MRSLAEAKARWDFTFSKASSLPALQTSIKQDTDDNPCINGLRSVCWKAFLVFEHLDQGAWSKTIHDARGAYASLKEHLLRDINHPDGILGDDPLADDETSPWNTLRKDEILRAEIFQDVERCMPENLYFREPTTQAILLDILFIYCKLNADIGYRQGMHEILAPIVWVVSRDAIQLETKDESSQSIPSHDRLILTMLDRRFIEHDAFTIFGILMQTAKSFYEMSPVALQQPNSSTTGQSAIVDRSRKIHEELLQSVDPELAAHLTEIDILPQIFVIRWIRLLFSREFQFEDVLRLWDAMFAEKHGLDLVDYVCVAMLLRIRWQLVDADHNAALAILLHYPPSTSARPATLIDDALSLRRSLRKETGNRLIAKHSGRTPTFGQQQISRTPLHSPNLSEDFFNARSPLRSPGQILSDAGGGLEVLLQQAAKGVYRRSEQWGIGQALRSAVQGLQTSGGSPYRASNRAQGLSRDDGTDVNAKLLSLEKRDKALAKMLGDAMEELSAQTKLLEAEKKEDLVNNLTLTIAKLQFIQVHLDTPSLPLEAPSKDTFSEDKHKEKDGDPPDTQTLPPLPKSPSPAPSNSQTSQAQHGLGKSSNSGRKSPIRAPARRPPNISTVQRGIASLGSPDTPQPGSAFQQSRPSLASSSFSWMLGNEDSTMSFTSPTSLIAEKDKEKRSATRGKVGFLFGESSDTPPFKPKGKSSTQVDAEDDDGFTLGTLRGIGKARKRQDEEEF